VILNTAPIFVKINVGDGSSPLHSEILLLKAAECVPSQEPAGGRIQDWKFGNSGG
jgi:hypothetical protein